MPAFGLFTATELMNTINGDGKNDYTLKEAFHNWLINYSASTGGAWRGVTYTSKDLNKYGTEQEVLNVICGAGLNEYTVEENLNRIRENVAGQTSDFHSHSEDESFAVIANGNNFKNGAGAL